MVVIAAIFLLLSISSPQQLYHQRQFKESLRSLGDAGQNSLLAAMNYFQLNDLDKANNILTNLTQQHPDNSQYFDWLGKIYGKRAEQANPFRAPGLAAKARDAFERAVKLDGTNRDALGDLFDYYLDAPGFLGGGADKAAQIAARSKTIDPNASLQEQGRLAEKRKDWQAAESFYRQAVKLTPKAPGNYIALARALSKQGRDAESDAVFVQANKTLPGVPRLWFAQAELLIRQKRNPDQAQLLLNQYLAASLTADDPPPEKARDLLNQVKK